MARRILAGPMWLGKRLNWISKSPNVVGVAWGSYLLPASTGKSICPILVCQDDINNDGSHKVGTYIVYFKVRQKEDMPKPYAEVNEWCINTFPRRIYSWYFSSAGSVLADLVQSNTNEIDWCRPQLYGGAWLTGAYIIWGMISSLWTSSGGNGTVRSPANQTIIESRYGKICFTCIGGLMDLLFHGAAC